MIGNTIQKYNGIFQFYTKEQPQPTLVGKLPLMFFSLDSPQKPSLESMNKPIEVELKGQLENRLRVLYLLV